jgi:hypothetical protein
MTLRKGEISQARPRRERPYRVADKVRGLKNSEVVRGFVDTLSVAPLTYSMSRDELDFVVFWFAKPEDAEAFCRNFGGERTDRLPDGPGDDGTAPECRDFNPLH